MNTGYPAEMVFFFKQKTAYEIGWCDWSSDVCSSDLSLTACCNSVPLSLSTEDAGCGLPSAECERSEERRVGKECTIQCRSRGSPDHQKKNIYATEKLMDELAQYNNVLPQRH